MVALDHELLAIVEHVSMYVEYVVKCILRSSICTARCSVSPSCPVLSHISHASLDVVRIPANPILICDSSRIFPGIWCPVLGPLPKAICNRSNCIDDWGNIVTERSRQWARQKILNNISTQGTDSP